MSQRPHRGHQRRKSRSFDCPAGRRAKYIARAVAAGKSAFLGDSAATGDDNLIDLAPDWARWPATRPAMPNWPTDLWHGAYGRIQHSEYKAECAAEAADVAMNDLIKPALAKPLIEEASHSYDKNQTGTVASNIRRVLGDYYAVTGNGKSAREGLRPGGKGPQFTGIPSSKTPGAGPTAAARKSTSGPSSTIGRYRKCGRGSWIIPPKRLTARSR